MELPANLMETLSSLEQTGFASAVRTTPRLYPVLMSLHVIGITLMVGAALVVDLRLLGFGRAAIPVTVATRHLLPLSHAGFAIVLATGLTMFCAVALMVGGSAAAPWKFGLIALAGLNILIFHKGVYRSVSAWDIGASPPPAAKVAALISALSWIGVIFAGRFLAY